ANYTVKNIGGAPVQMGELYLMIRDPNGQNVDLGGVWNTSPLLPDQTRNVFKSRSDFAEDCSACVTGSYVLTAQMQKQDGSWTPISQVINGAISSIHFNVGP